MFAIVLLIALISMLSVCAFADSGEDIDANLRSRGYPQVLIESMSKTAKEALYHNQNLVFDGGVVTTYDEETGIFAEYNVPANGIATIGQIPTADLLLTFTVSRYLDSPGLVYVMYSYTWNNLPYFRWQDPIAVSWDEDLYRLQDNSFYKVDKYDYQNYVSIDGVAIPVGDPVVGAIHDEDTGYARGSESGVSWYADLKGNGLMYDVEELYGHGEFTLVKKYPADAPVTTVLYGHYVHPTASVGVSINIAGYGSFSIEGGSGYDERGSQQTIVY